MKKNKTNRAEQTVAELTKELHQLLRDLAVKRQEKKVGRLTNMREVSVIADEIARIKTIVSQKALTEVQK